jgi:hypothetical protein
MRGKKIDSEFLSNFITDCIGNGKSTTDDILLEARNQIAEIDEKIIEVERLKIIRSKLLDVVIAFGGNNKQKSEDYKLLNLFNISNIHICKFICDNLKDSAVQIEALYNHGYSIEDIIFCIKQLIEHKVVSRAGNFLLRGESFNMYTKHVLRIDE